MIEEIIELTEGLIRIPSVARQPTEIQRCAGHIENFLRIHQVPFRRFDHNGCPSILIAPPDHDPEILLMAHFDVVDGDERMFEPKIEGDCLFGRGSIDDKYAVALAMLLARQHYKTCRSNQRRPRLSVLLTGDEEVGGKDGAQKVLPLIHPQFCIALDGGTVDRIIVKEKGLLTLKLVARGKCAHGSRPWLGENAIENLFADFSAIKTLFAKTTPDHWHRTINWGVVSGGKAHNQVPDRAQAILDVRYTDKEDVDAIVSEIRALINGELFVERCEPLFEGGQSPYLERLKQLAPGSRLTREHGSSDARFLSDHGIPGIVWGAEGDMSQHSDHEHIRIGSLARICEILERFIQDPLPK